MTTYTLPTTWERGSMRITTPRDRLDTGRAAWFCNGCGDGRSTVTRSPDEITALAEQWRAHVCEPLPERWLIAPAEMPCDLCAAHTRSRSPRGRPCHPVCAARRTARHTATTTASHRATPDRAAARRPDRTPGPPARPGRGDRHRAAPRGAT
ncbi:hypothetical protein [Streptomyces sp. SID3343]|uniref:hypothetical protein n=1 Tax=Streptomyces sp. SID3343 TaxID=2690260 RepID=UPI00137140B1|nr:hypothetical protein [Streptomyces sp. SID3343]MYW06048.1 hypothetical protein [Streptomyces sp. SID3343]